MKKLILPIFVIALVISNAHAGFLKKKTSPTRLANEVEFDSNYECENFKDIVDSLSRKDKDLTIDAKCIKKHGYWVLASNWTLKYRRSPKTTLLMDFPTDRSCINIEVLFEEMDNQKLEVEPRCVMDNFDLLKLRNPNWVLLVELEIN